MVSVVRWDGVIGGGKDGNDNSGGVKVVGRVWTVTMVFDTVTAAKVSQMLAVVPLVGMVRVLAVILVR